MNGDIRRPLMAIDEDDEFFPTLSNVGMIMRPDLFEQHTVHFHGYPNTSAFYEACPTHRSRSTSAADSRTIPGARRGNLVLALHVTPPEHLQMGMVGQLYVRPRQNRVPSSMTLYEGLSAQQQDLRTKCDSKNDVLCTITNNVAGWEIGIPPSTSTLTLSPRANYVPAAEARQRQSVGAANTVLGRGNQRARNRYQESGNSK